MGIADRLASGNFFREPVSKRHLLRRSFELGLTAFAVNNLLACAGPVMEKTAIPVVSLQTLSNPDYLQSHLNQPVKLQYVWATVPHYIVDENAFTLTVLVNLNSSGLAPVGSHEFRAKETDKLAGIPNPSEITRSRLGFDLASLPSPLGYEMTGVIRKDDTPDPDADQIIAGRGYFLELTKILQVKEL